MRAEEPQGASADDSFKEQRNEAAAGGVDEVKGRSACAVWVSVGGTTAIDRQMGWADGNRPTEREKQRKKKGMLLESCP